MLHSRPPRSRALAPFVESLWTHDGELPHRFERVLPSGRMQLLVNLHSDELRDHPLAGGPVARIGGAGLQGTRTAPTIVDTADQRAICGVSFAPGGASAVVDVPASEFTGRLVDLSDLWGSGGAELRERLAMTPDPAARLDLLENTLLGKLDGGRPRDRAIEAACLMIGNGTRIHVVRDRLDISPGQFTKRFRSRVGLGPKHFARITRIQRLLRCLGGKASWAETAERHGFSDQPHLVREFREFTGTTPTRYTPRSARERNHVLLDGG